MKARIIKILGMIVFCIILACYVPFVSAVLSLYTLDTLFH